MEIPQISVPMHFFQTVSHDRLFNGSALRQCRRVRHRQLRRPLPCRFRRCSASSTPAGRALYAPTFTQLWPQRPDALRLAIFPMEKRCRLHLPASTVAMTIPVTSSRLPLLTLTTPQPPEAFYRNICRP
jgi:hypothetical protein